MLTVTDQIKISKRDRMAEIEAPYKRALIYRASEKANEDRLVALEKIEKIVGARIFVEQGAAQQIIGRIQQVLEDLKEHTAVVYEYESLKKSLAEMNEK
jgi:cell shape-determining protein MreC